MGRKIKTKNRKKLKSVDPFNIHSSRRGPDLKKNLPPKDYEQETPKWFKNIISKPQQETESTKKKRKRKPDTNKMEGYEKKSWETDKQFLRRVERSTHDYVSDQMVKIQFGLDGVNPTDVLDINHGKKKRSSADNGKEKVETDGKKRKLKKKELEGEVSSGNTSVTREKKGKAKRREEKKLRRKRKLEEEVDPLYLREVIPFGERVDAPPQLTAAPKNAKKDKSWKAGARDLLLKQTLASSAMVDQEAKRKRYENDGTIKCDDPAKQRVLEEERTRVIEAYRVQKRLIKKRGESE